MTWRFQHYCPIEALLVGSVFLAVTVIFNQAIEILFDDAALVVLMIAVAFCVATFRRRENTAYLLSRLQTGLLVLGFACAILGSAMGLKATKASEIGSAVSVAYSGAGMTFLFAGIFKAFSVPKTGERIFIPTVILASAFAWVLWTTKEIMAIYSLENLMENILWATSLWVLSLGLCIFFWIQEQRKSIKANQTPATPSPSQ